MLATGLVMLPCGLVEDIVSSIVGRMHDVVGPRPLAIGGVLLDCVS